MVAFLAFVSPRVAQGQPNHAPGSSGGTKRAAPQGKWHCTTLLEDGFEDLECYATRTECEHTRGMILALLPGLEASPCKYVTKDTAPPWHCTKLRGARLGGGACLPTRTMCERMRVALSKTDEVLAGARMSPCQPAAAAFCDLGNSGDMPTCYPTRDICVRNAEHGPCGKVAKHGPWHCSSAFNSCERTRKACDEARERYKRETQIDSTYFLAATAYCLVVIKDTSAAQSCYWRRRNCLAGAERFREDGATIAEDCTHVE
jgi:hypothetical protein